MCSQAGCSYSLIGPFSTGKYDEVLTLNCFAGCGEPWSAHNQVCVEASDNKDIVHVCDVLTQMDIQSSTRLPLDLDRCSDICPVVEL